MEGLAVVIVSMLFARRLRRFVTWLRLPTQSEQKVSMVSNIAVFQFMLTIVLIMLTDASFIDIESDGTNYFRRFFRGN